MSETVTARDLRGMRGLVVDGRRAEPTEGLPWLVVEGLAALIACDAITVPENDVVRGRLMVQQNWERGTQQLYSGARALTPPLQFWRHLRAFLPCSCGERTGDFTQASRWSDFYSDRQLREVPLIADYWGGDGSRYGMSIALLPGRLEHRRSVCLWRSSGCDFSDRDRDILELLRPHLWEIYVAGQRRRAPVPRLSRRECEVLRLADQGRSNAEIAALLHISVGTVRKHLEHIFDRTGARTRTASAALVFPRLD